MDPYVSTKTLQLRPEGHRSRELAITNYAFALQRFFVETNDFPSLQKSIELSEMAIPFRPQGHSGRTELFSTLSVKLFRCYQLTNDIQYLEKIMPLSNEILDGWPPGHVSRDFVPLSTLGNAAHAHYVHTSDMSSLERSVILLEELLNLDHADGPLRCIMLANYVDALRDMYIVTQDDSLLERCIGLANEAHESSQPESLEQATTMALVGNLSQLRYQRVGGESLLRNVNYQMQEAVVIAPENHPSRLEFVNNLAVAIVDLHQYGIETHDFPSPIELHRYVLEHRPPGHPRRAATLTNLGAALCATVYPTQDVEPLYEAVRLAEEALTLIPVDSSRCFSPLSIIGASRDGIYEHTGDPCVLDAAITALERALSLRPNGPDRANAQGNLALALTHCFYQGGDVQFLDRAIALLEDSLSRRPPGHIERELTLNNLGDVLNHRAKFSSDVAFVNKSIAFFEELLELHPHGHPRRARTLAHLGTAYLYLFLSRKELHHVDKAIELHREALGMRPSGHVQHDTSLTSLGLALHARSSFANDFSALVEATCLFRQSFDACTLGNPTTAISCHKLACALRDQFKHTGDADDLNQAISLAEEALKHQEDHFTGDVSSHLVPSVLQKRYVIRWRVACNLAELQLLEGSSPGHLRRALHYLSQVLSTNEGSPGDLLRRTTPTVRIALRILRSVQAEAMLEEISHAALQICRQMVDLLPLVANFSLNLSDRLRELKEIEPLGVDAATQAVALSQPEIALEILEQARGIFWSQALHLRDPHLEQLPPDMAHELEALMHDLDQDVTSDDVHAGILMRRHQQSNRVQQILRQVRQMPHLERFLLGPSFADLTLAAAKGPIVVLTGHETHCNAIILLGPTGSTICLPLPDITSDAIRDMSVQLNPCDARQIAKPQKGNRHMSISYPRQTPAVEAILHTLWWAIVKPVIDAIGIKVKPAFASTKMSLLLLETI
jgi:tetratricopeptide (TPR) repeat protein